MKAVHCIRSGALSVNTWIFKLIEKKVFVVDPAACEASGDETKIADYLKENSLECAAIILTHAHFDHITGVAAIKRLFPSAKIAIHRADFSEFNAKNGKMNTSILHNFGMEEILPILQRQPDADIQLEDGDTLAKILPAAEPGLKAALDSWRVILTPGHTPGSICLYNAEEGLLISGDTLFDGACGRTDMYGGDEKQMQQSLRLLYNKIPGGTHVFPGHDRDFYL